MQLFRVFRAKAVPWYYLDEIVFLQNHVHMLRGVSDYPMYKLYKTCIDW